MGRRGPDHAAAYRSTLTDNGEVLLLHTRLNIIDLDPRSNQPFREGKKVIVFNGEIYNYLEMRRELEAQGRTFRTSSDTEVLMQAIETVGWDALEKLEGMWAFAFYDEVSKSLVLSRDRFGEKPLYVFEDETGLYFGSEIKFIFALLGRRLPVNSNHVCRYLVNGYKALYKTNEQFFVGLTSVPRASCQSIAVGNRFHWTYWQPHFSPDESLSFDEAVHGVRHRLEQSVKIRLRADVPLAFCLSGGIDSNSIIGVAKKVFNQDVHAFTIVTNDARYDENEMVAEMVHANHLKHTIVSLDQKDFLPHLREQVRYHDSPVATISYYVHWLLQQEIRRNGYRISVSGTGADEIFSGYFDHHLAYLYEIRQDRVLHDARRKAWEQNVRPLVRNPYLSDADLFVKNRSFRDHIFLQADDFSNCLVKHWSEAFSEERYTDDLLRNRMLNEMFHEVVPVILHEDDLNAMYHSIENRSPFLDRTLFEFALRIPTRHLIQNGRAKYVLREAMRGIVPDAILDNARKVGFNASINSLLNMSDPHVQTELFADSPVFDYVDREKIRPYLQKAAMPNSESKFVFNFVNAKLFLEEFAA